MKREKDREKIIGVEMKMVKKRSGISKNWRRRIKEKEIRVKEKGKTEREGGSGKT